MEIREKEREQRLKRMKRRYDNENKTDIDIRRRMNDVTRSVVLEKEKQNEETFL